MSKVRLVLRRGYERLPGLPRPRLHGGQQVRTSRAPPRRRSAAAPRDAWFTMLFATGIGSILMLWGAAEPVRHPGDPQRGRWGMAWRRRSSGRTAVLRDGLLPDLRPDPRFGSTRVSRPRSGPGDGRRCLPRGGGASYQEATTSTPSTTTSRRRSWSSRRHRGLTAALHLRRGAQAGGHAARTGRQPQAGPAIADG